MAIKKTESYSSLWANVKELSDKVAGHLKAMGLLRSLMVKA